MVASSVISMSIRQIRHLSEKPSDFFRLPVFIIVSTFFLMPIRLLGFFRMAHASGWGTRAGAYAGGPGEVSSEEEIARHTAGAVPAGPTAPAAEPASTGAAARALPDAVGGVTTTTALATRAQITSRAEAKAAEARAAEAAAEAPARTTKPRRRLNPLAAIPYLIGFAILTLEALFLV
jgi:hyaluronan synthase